MADDIHSGAFFIDPNTKNQVIKSNLTPNIDANYGPWNNIAEYLSFMDENLGLIEDDILPGTIIAVYNTPESPETSGITRYIRENGAWRSLESGGRNNSYSNDIYYKNSTCT